MLSFFPRDVLDEILDLIESVSEGFPTYSLYVLSYSQGLVTRGSYSDITVIMRLDKVRSELSSLEDRLKTGRPVCAV